MRLSVTKNGHSVVMLCSFSAWSKLRAYWYRADILWSSHGGRIWTSHHLSPQATLLILTKESRFKILRNHDRRSKWKCSRVEETEPQLCLKSVSQLVWVGIQQRQTAHPYQRIWYFFIPDFVSSSLWLHSAYWWWYCVLMSYTVTVTVLLSGCQLLQTLWLGV